jgi:hypothetical protein
MRTAALFAVPAALMLAACADGVLTLPTPGTVFGKQAEYVAQFCAPEFVEQPTAAINEWLGLYNALAPLADLEPIDAGKYTESEIAAKFFAAREIVCLTAAAPEAAPEA